MANTETKKELNMLFGLNSDYTEFKYTEFKHEEHELVTSGSSMKNLYDKKTCNKLFPKLTKSQNAIINKAYKGKVSELPNEVLRYIKNDVLAMVEFYADTDSIKVNK